MNLNAIIGDTYCDDVHVVLCIYRGSDHHANWKWRSASANIFILRSVKVDCWEQAQNALRSDWSSHTEKLRAKMTGNFAVPQYMRGGTSYVRFDQCSCAHTFLRRALNRKRPWEVISGLQGSKASL